ncbi:2-dehydro-3-deoxygalactonokinase [Actibacterium sp. 188UL27-1]|uniref:2-dehydro-3-deoxygalactonokinase n=1 Tax=Actibacterium sp. 188UL27-1 TaxID=2786961 RepID=UPI001956C68F|nr:2-dehydro-3-deoxygalactonokinase [Actibacterium sp. 188UL27-1]MBM7066286.1 2-dehydro-3-deoxygalactonokinase [Actibacterium sp. 188UL27-1]
MTGTPDWIAVDWGTSRLRAWGMTASGTELWQRCSENGMGQLARDAFEDALLDLVGDTLGHGPIPVIACGMVGARQGWVEAAYRAVPCPPLDADTLTQAPCGDLRLTVKVIGGLKQIDPADVMRGEETQIAGFLALNPDFDGVICLPGSHSKWARISAGEVVSFQTFLTGEMFAALSQHTVLRHTVQSDRWDDAAFATAISDALSRPERLAARLFTLRAEALLNDLPPAPAAARLSGTLIGAELAAARPYWLGQDVALIGATDISRHYATALAQQGVPATIADVDAMTLKGLVKTRAHLKEPAA